MKQSFIEALDRFKKDLQSLKRDVAQVAGETINRVAIRDSADALATRWVEELRSPLEHKFKLPGQVIEAMSADMKKLHVISRPSNRKSSYIIVLNSALKKFDDRIILPLKQSTSEVKTILELQKLIPGLANPEESAYLKEAIECAEEGHKRAAIVMGWCAVIDKIQQCIVRIGLNKFNSTSSGIKAQTSGKFKHWNKEFACATLSELQTVFDTDLIVVLEGWN